MHIKIFTSYIFLVLKNNKYLIRIMRDSILFDKICYIQSLRSRWKTKEIQNPSNNINILVQIRLNNLLIGDFFLKTSKLSSIISNVNNKKKSPIISSKNKLRIPSYYTLNDYNERVILPSNLRTEEYILSNQKRFLNAFEFNRLKFINDQKVFVTPYFYFPLPSKSNEYYAFFSKSRMNLFLTLTDIKGKVIISRSTGWCGIHSKKKKKSSDAFKAVCEKFAKDCISKNIKIVSRFFTKFGPLSAIRSILTIFSSQHLEVQNFTFIRGKPHSFDQKMRKLRRI